MYPPIYPQDELKLLYPGVYLLHGSIRMGPGMRMNRNMLVLQNGNELILVNPVRMNDENLERLEQLGRVAAIFRLGDFHGLDDRFYVDRYQCEFWAQDGQETYPLPVPTTVMRPDTKSPIPDTEFFFFDTPLYPEAALLIKNHRLLITTDSVQYHSAWRHFSGFTKVAFRILGFKSGLNIGPPWLRRVTPKGGSLRVDFDRLLSLDFEALIGAHGELLARGARAALKGEVARIWNLPSSAGRMGP